MSNLAGCLVVDQSSARRKVVEGGLVRLASQKGDRIVGLQDHPPRAPLTIS